MRPRALVLFTAMAMFVVLGTARQTYAQKFKDQIISFDVAPNAATYPADINSRGEITGFYYDTNGVHGFLREEKGNIVTFDVPGATHYIPGGTVPSGINARGEITGQYFAAGSIHGFLRTPHGTIITFDAPDSLSTEPRGINERGEITGACGDTRAGVRGFVRHADGTFHKFDASPLFTYSSSINSRGEITGLTFLDPTGRTYQGYVRAPDGEITKFRVEASDRTHPTDVNPRGEITGFYFDANGNVHGFVRTPQRTITTFDAADEFSGATPTGINPGGEIVGSASGNGFVRYADGDITLFDVGGSHSTTALKINPNGEVTGYYTNASGTHGFLRKPDWFRWETDF
jgi:uncharacterized membrane protein